MHLAGFRSTPAWRRGSRHTAGARFRSCPPLRKAAAILCKEGRVAPLLFYPRPHLKVLYSSSRPFGVARYPITWSNRLLMNQTAVTRELVRLGLALFALLIV